VARPVLRLFSGFAGDSKSDATVEGDAFELDVEALAVGVWPNRTDASPEAFLSVTVADLIGDVAGSF
jgi:hypothetical protein